MECVDRFYVLFMLQSRRDVCVRVCPRHLRLGALVEAICCCVWASVDLELVYLNRHHGLNGGFNGVASDREMVIEDRAKRAEKKLLLYLGPRERWK